MTESSKPDKAVALTYDGSRAPFVSASGGDDLAETIIRIARQHNVPIYENKALVDILARLEVGSEIPEILYRTIAEIIAFVYMLKGKAPAGFKHQAQTRQEKEVKEDEFITKQLPAPSADSDDQLSE